MKQKNKEILKKTITVPNILTLFRLGLIPVIIWLYCVKEEYLWTTLVIVASGITDIVDGFIARRFNMISVLGKFLDPIADKFTQIAVLICLVLRFPLMLLPIFCMIGKEIFVGSVALFAIKKSGSVPRADWHGKLATFFLYSTMILHTLWYNITPLVSAICIVLCTVMIEVSLVFYSVAHFKLMIMAGKKSHEREDQTNN